MQRVASLLCGLIFGFGLLISGMTQPGKVLGFLDIFGRWDPTLAFVMAAALASSGIGYALARRRQHPFLAPQLIWPAKTRIDRPLVVGSTLFGIGWGLAGLCPGPAIENLASLSPRVIVFVFAMVVGTILKDFLQLRIPSVTAIENSTLASSDG
jgi:uncharacterized membrane protein YedE/YeeE